MRRKAMQNDGDNHLPGDAMAAAVVNSGSTNKMLMRRKTMQNGKDNHLPGDAMAQQHQEAESTDAMIALLKRRKGEQQQSATINLEGLVMPKEDEDNWSSLVEEDDNAEEEREGDEEDDSSVEDEDKSEKKNKSKKNSKDKSKDKKKSKDKSKDKKEKGEAVKCEKIEKGDSLQCEDGMIDHKRSRSPRVFETKANSKDKCKALCAKHDCCIAFDFTEIGE